MRVAVDDGSKPADAGVTRALRLGVMLSSMAARDTRRKSGGRKGSAHVGLCEEGCRLLPRSATVEKQNCGVSLGAGDGWAMVSGGEETDASGEDFDQRNLARVKMLV